MESNRDEALRCIEIAQNFYSEGKLPQALKFINKSLSLYPTDTAKELLDKFESDNRQNSSHSTPAQPQPRQSHTTDAHSHTEDHTNNKTKRAYTQEQLDAVLKIKQCKDYYSILGVSREATDVELKKQYRKIALQMHPDKNHAPGAEEAFKAVSQAFACLSDPAKRSQYDKYGKEEPQHNVGTRRSNFNGFESDITPEELFEMMFNLNRSQGNFRTYTYRTNMGGGGSGAHQQRRTNQEENANPLLLFIQFLPVILLLLSAFLWSSSYSDPLFSLKKTSAYSVPLITSARHVDYFVKPETAQKILSGDLDLRALEAEVERHWWAQMERQCHFERQQKTRMRQAANYYSGKRRDEMLHEANLYPTPSCDAMSKA